MLIYDAALHHPMGSRQSKLKSLDTDVGLGADSLDNSVFSLFYLPDVKAFNAISKRLRTVAGSVAYAATHLADVNIVATPESRAILQLCHQPFC